VYLVGVEGESTSDQKYWLRLESPTHVVPASLKEWNDAKEVQPYRFPGTLNPDLRTFQKQVSVSYRNRTFRRRGQYFTRPDWAVLPSDDARFLLVQSYNGEAPSEFPMLHDGEVFSEIFEVATGQSVALVSAKYLQNEGWPILLNSEWLANNTLVLDYFYELKKKVILCQFPNKRQSKE
jgi:hypothetical protein